MRGISGIFGRIDSVVDGLLERRPGLGRAVVSYGFVGFLLLAVLFLVAGAAVPEGRGQEIVYATDDGGIYSVSPGTGRTETVFAPDEEGFATAPLLNGGSRSLSFTVLRGDEDSFRGDLYGADLVRGTRAMLQGADYGEVLLNGGYSSDRTWLLASRYSVNVPPDVSVYSASGAEMLYVEPPSGGTPAILGPTWTARNSLYGWRTEGDSLSLTAYDYFERRQVVVYETERRVGRPSYNFDSNTTVFDVRDGDGSVPSRLVSLVGTAEYPLDVGFDVYDPSLPVPELDDEMAVIWDDGRTTGVGLFDPASRTFEKTPVEVERGSRQPQVSYDGNFVVTSREGLLTIRRMDDGEVVRRIDGVQTSEEPYAKMRRAGLDVPPEADWFAAPSYSWRSVADS